ncbi:MAG: membrane protein insertion efficiency factor YidD [Gammaproteobacteria bacterium]
MRVILLSLIRFYRFAVSPLLGANCRFYPNCSLYAETAVRRFGIRTGTWLTIRRLVRCQPYHPGGFDPVPDRGACSHRKVGSLG